MADIGAGFRLNLLGAFRLIGPDGERVEISSRKGVALIALLAMTNEGERTRGWLQDTLWGTRDQVQAQGSLRRELSNLRDRLNTRAPPLLVCERDRVRLDLRQIRIDVRELDSPEADGLGGPSAPSARLVAGEFLEGLDLAGEDRFEDWLREQRSRLRDRADRPGVPSAPPLPARILDVSQPAPGFAGRPALAVLPFLNLTGEPDNDYLAEGLSEDLIDRLSRLRWLPVIARSSSFSLGGDPVDHAAIGERLGAKYLFEGRLRRASEGFSLAVDLSDALSRQVLWSHRLEMPSVHSQQAQAQLAAELVGALDTRIDRAEQLSALARPPSDLNGDLNVNDLIWRGRWHFNRLTREDAERARILFGEALAREPESPEALLQVTWALERSLWAERGSEAEIRRMCRMAQDVISLDSEDSRGYMLAGIGELWLRHPSRAKNLLNHAIYLNPSLAGAHANLGSTYNLSGEPALAIAPLMTALRLSPNDQEVFFILGEIAMAHSLLSDWPQAIDHAEQSIIRRGAYWYAHVLKINALARLGDMVAAGSALDDLLAVRPGFTDRYIDWVPFHDAAWADHFKLGLAMAADRPGARAAAGYEIARD